MPDNPTPFSSLSINMLVEVSRIRRLEAENMTRRQMGNSYGHSVYSSKQLRLKLGFRQVNLSDNRECKPGDDSIG